MRLLMNFDESYWLEDIILEEINQLIFEINKFIEDFPLGQFYDLKKISQINLEIKGELKHFIEESKHFHY